MNQFFKLFENLFNGIKLNQETAVWDAPGFLNISRPDSGEIKRQTRSKVLYERITLPMTAEMREGFERMARELQRKRSQKNKRITANTVMRVALEFLWIVLVLIIPTE